MLLITAEGHIEFGKLSKPYLNTSWFDKGNWQDHCHVKVDQNLRRTERNHKSDNFD